MLLRVNASQNISLNFGAGWKMYVAELLRIVLVLMILGSRYPSKVWNPQGGLKS